MKLLSCHTFRSNFLCRQYVLSDGQLVLLFLDVFVAFDVLSTDNFLNLLIAQFLVPELRRHRQDSVDFSLLNETEQLDFGQDLGISRDSKIAE